MSFNAALEQAAKSAVCGWLANGGNAVAATWIVNGSKTPWTAVAGAGAALGLLALNYGCNYDPDAGAADPNSLIPPGCKEIAAGDYLTFGIACNSGGWGISFRKFVSLVNTGRPGNFGTFYWKLTGQKSDGTLVTKEFPRTEAEMATYSLLNCSNKLCVDMDQDGGWKPEPLAPYTYVDATTNCSYVVELDSWLLDPTGNAQPVMKISAGAQTRASGGIIGGCNFDPVIYIPPGGGGGGGTVAPWLPGPDGPDGEPWWWPIAQAALGRLLGAAVEELLRKIFEEKSPATVYRVVSVCETDAEGEPVSLSREVAIPELPLLPSIVARIDAMDDLMQGLKDFKQPICPPVRPQLTGEWVTVNFLSDEPSPMGEKRLRKHLRYRDQTFSDQEPHIAHWENFVWQAGPVWVASKNLSWGTPSVWAESAEEGKRVIRHAAQIAGVDLDDPAHQWVISSSGHPRYGQPGTMRVDTRGGRFVRVTKRPGPSGLPLGRPPAS